MRSKHEIDTLVEIVQIGPNGQLRSRWRVLVEPVFFESTHLAKYLYFHFIGDGSSVAHRSFHSSICFFLWLWLFLDSLFVEKCDQKLHVCTFL